MKLKPQHSQRLSGPLAALIRSIGKTWRYAHPGAHPDGRRVIFAFRHGDMLMGVHAYRRQQVAVMISQHRDGEIIAQVCRRLGFRAVRGSTTRGGARALREFLKNHADTNWAITPDGPRGPRGSVAPGLVQLAALSGRPIVPLGIVAKSARRARSWDRFAIPLPFSRIAVHAGPPISIPRDFGDRTLEEWVDLCRDGIDESYREACESLGLDRHAEDP